MRIKTHLEMLKTDIDFRIEQTLRQIKPYDKSREIDNSGNMLIPLKDGSYQASTYKPFWEVLQ